jgi:hypothetical protein
LDNENSGLEVFPAIKIVPCYSGVSIAKKQNTLLGFVY